MLTCPCILFALYIFVKYGGSFYITFNQYLWGSLIMSSWERIFWYHLKVYILDFFTIFHHSSDFLRFSTKPVVTRIANFENFCVFQLFWPSVFLRFFTILQDIILSSFLVFLKKNAIFFQISQIPAIFGVYDFLRVLRGKAQGWFWWRISIDIDLLLFVSI